MPSDWTRRNFLGASIAAPPVLITSIEAATKTDAKNANLRAVIDEIIPAGNGMPAASEVGGVAYIEKLMIDEPAMGRVMEECLTTLNGNTASPDAFSKLSSPERIAALKQLEQNSAAHFALLRDSVYEAYYTRPQIWKLIGYELFPTDHLGPHMKPFDKSVIDVVSKKPRHYREA
jgi:hypothetical protein